jgi:hypothetical protein
LGGYKKRYGIVKEGQFYLYDSEEDAKAGLCRESIQMLTCSVKPDMASQKMQLVSLNKKYGFKIDDKALFMTWSAKLQEAILAALNSNASNKSSVRSKSG